MNDYDKCVREGVVWNERLGELDEILKKNPFLEVTSEWRTKCAEIRENRTDGADAKFILCSDEEWINEYNSRKRKNHDDLRLRINLIPQPFVGHPSAPIWILMLNPGYSSRDEYDYLSVAEPNKLQMMNESRKKKQEVRVLPPSEDEWCALEKRQEALLEQLRFSAGSFHLLEKSFNSLPGLSNGGYKYWKSHLFGNDEQYFMSWFKKDAHVIASEKVFVLEMMPYHSKCFDDSILTSESWNKSKYAIFWRDLVNYGIGNNKVFFVRSPNKVIRQLSFDTTGLKDICLKVCGRFLVLANPQGGRFTGRGLNVYLPLEDMMSKYVSMEQIVTNMRETRRRLLGIVPDNWNQVWRKCITVDE